MVTSRTIRICCFWVGGFLSSGRTRSCDSVRLALKIRLSSVEMIIRITSTAKSPIRPGGRSLRMTEGSIS